MGFTSKKCWDIAFDIEGNIVKWFHMYSYVSDGKAACMENNRGVVLLFLELKGDKKEWRRMSKRFFEVESF